MKRRACCVVRGGGGGDGGGGAPRASRPTCRPRTSGAKVAHAFSPGADGLVGSCSLLLL